MHTTKHDVRSIINRIKATILIAYHMHVPQTHETAVLGKTQIAAYHRMAFDLVKSIVRTWRTWRLKGMGKSRPAHDASHWDHIGAVAHPKAEY